ncbi:uncharacterized protein [Antedon mediterranea]|uniref:uncharacterized protein n=1 Tax=Antedon mediterranea TaxID=105859 RepID=UPI003AF51AC4
MACLELSRPSPMTDKKNEQPRSDVLDQSQKTRTSGIRGSKSVAYRAKADGLEANKRRYREPAGTLLSEPDEFMAAAIGDTAWLKQSLKDERNPNTLDKNGLAPIHLAALHGRLNCLQLLIEKYSVDVNLGSSTGWRPIHLSINNRIGKKSTQCLQYLLEKGADPSVTNEDNLTPVHQASIEGSVQCLNLLINAGGCIDVKDSKGQTPLDYAKIWGHRKCARIISSKSWKQEKEEYFDEIEKLKTLKNVKENEDFHQEEGRKADKEFYGQLSFTNWLDNKGLQGKNTGPTARELSPVAWSKQPRKYIELHGDWALKGHRGVVNPNSIRKDDQQHQLKELVKDFEKSLATKKGSKTNKKSGIKDSQTTLKHRLANSGQKRAINLPDEVVEKVLFDKPSPHQRPLTFKCHNIIDSQHKKIWEDEDKPLVEMYAHLSNSLDSSLFPKKGPISSVQHSKEPISSGHHSKEPISSGQKDESSRIYKSMKQISKPYRFPNITGEEYKYRFEII